jgi:hypothetical protein
MNSEQLENKIEEIVQRRFAHILEDISFRIGQQYELAARNANGVGVTGKVFAEDLKLLDRHFITGYTVTANSPAAGSIAWTDLHIVYNGQNYDITNGNTAMKYAYWSPTTTPTVLLTNNTKPNLATGEVLLFMNNGGTPVVMLSDTNASLPKALADGTVDSGAILANAVTNAAIATGAVNSASLAANAVTTNAIASGAVTSTGLAANAVTANAIATGAVGTAQIGANAVTSGSIANGAIVRETQINTGVVGANSLAANAVTATKLADGAVVRSSQLTANVVDSTALANAAVDTAALQANAVTSTILANGAVVRSAQLSTNVVTTSAIAPNAVTTTEINAGAVDATRLSILRHVLY